MEYIVLILIVALLALFAQYWYISIPLAVIGFVIYAIGKKKLRQSRYHDINFDLMGGHEFEKFCADLLKDNGYTKVAVTQGSGDHGIDVLAERDGKKYAIQCKCYGSKVGNKAVQEAYSGKDIYNSDVGVVMTNSYFTPQAKQDAKKLKILLWDRNQILYFIKYANLQYNLKNVEQKFQRKETTEDVEQKLQQKETIENVGTKDKKEVTTLDNNYYADGIYIVGQDIEKGTYVFETNDMGFISIYESYSQWLKGKRGQLVTVKKEYQIPLMQDGMVVKTEECKMRKL